MTEQRHYTRTDSHFGVRLTTGDGVMVARLCDISVGGCRLAAPAALARGGEATLEIAGFGQLLASVIWSRGGEAGLRFHEAPERVGEILLAMATYGPGEGR